jgi:hypothetical protein
MKTKKTTGLPKARTLTISMKVKPFVNSQKVGSCALSMALKRVAEQMDAKRVGEVDDICHQICDEKGLPIGTWELC